MKHKVDQFLKILQKNVEGRSSLKQYLPMGPVKRGVKVWMLVDAHNA